MLDRDLPMSKEKLGLKVKIEAMALPQLCQHMAGQNCAIQNTKVTKSTYNAHLRARLPGIVLDRSMALKG